MQCKLMAISNYDFNSIKLSTTKRRQVISNMEYHSSYPPGQARAKGGSCHRSLPPLPNKRFFRVTRQYCRYATFLLVGPNDAEI